MLEILSLIEKRTRGTPRIWLVGCEIEPREGGRVVFEFGYLANGFGANHAILVPSGDVLPEIRIAVPVHVTNLPTGMILQKGSYFTIEKIQLE